MKSTARSKSREKKETGLRAEYNFDYAKSKANRFANTAKPGALAVLLDPDVAKVFKDAQSVNDVRRALMTTMPARRPAANQ
jgi:hypothetical protein